MDELKPGKKQSITIRDLYPGLDAEQLKEAEENLERYVELALRIFERIRSDPDTYAQFRSLTDSSRSSSMHDARSSSTSPSNPSSSA